MKSAARRALLMLLLGLAASSLGGERVRLASGEWPPYFSRHLPGYGIGSRIVTDAFARVGVEVEYGFFPWKRSLKLAEEGIWDGTPGWESSPERTRSFYVSDPVWEAPWVLFHLKSHPLRWRRLEDLRGLRIGGTLGYIYAPELYEAERAGVLQLERAGSDALNFRKLLSGRLDAFPQLADVGQYQLRNLFDPATVARFTHDDRSLGTHSDHLLLSRRRAGNQEMIERFDSGLRALKESGEYAQYFVQTPRPGLDRQLDQ